MVDRPASARTTCQSARKIDARSWLGSSSVVQTPAGGRSPGCVAERCESGGTVYRRSANAKVHEKLLVDENAQRRDRERTNASTSAPPGLARGEAEHFRKKAKRDAARAEITQGLASRV
jgi:hypothetical protein